MVLNQGLWIFDLRRKKHRRLPKTKKLSFLMGIPKELTFLNKFIGLNFDLIWKNYVTLAKTMGLW